MMRWDPDFGIAFPSTAGADATVLGPHRAAATNRRARQRPNLSQCFTELSLFNNFVVLFPKSVYGFYFADTNWLVFWIPLTPRHAIVTRLKIKRS